MTLGITGHHNFLVDVQRVMGKEPLAACPDDDRSSHPWVVCARIAERARHGRRPGEHAPGSGSELRAEIARVERLARSGRGVGCTASIGPDNRIAHPSGGGAGLESPGIRVARRLDDANGKSFAPASLRRARLCDARALARRRARASAGDNDRQEGGGDERATLLSRKSQDHGLVESSRRGEA